MSDEEKKASEQNQEGDAQGDKEQAEDGDGEVYNQGNDVLEEGSEAGFRCSNPQMRSGHIEYSC
jgi:hypothetical protein